MALAVCVKVVLCGLSNATRQAINTVLGAYIIQLNLARAALELKLVKLNVATVPVQLLNTAIQGVVNEIKAGANIIPISVIGDCIGVGDINAAIQSNLDILLVDANIITSDLQRLLSFRDEVQGVLDDLESVILLYEEVLTLLTTC